MPGNVFGPAIATGLARDAVRNVTSLMTPNNDDLTDRTVGVPTNPMDRLDRGLRRVLALCPSVVCMRAARRCRQTSVRVASMTALMVCMRFSAWSKTIEAADSNTSSVTSRAVMPVRS